MVQTEWYSSEDPDISGLYFDLIRNVLTICVDQKGYKTNLWYADLNGKVLFWDEPSREAAQKRALAECYLKLQSGIENVRRELYLGGQ